jgi:hypothetical protein
MGKKKLGKKWIGKLTNSDCTFNCSMSTKRSYFIKLGEGKLPFFFIKTYLVIK